MERAINGKPSSSLWSHIRSDWNNQATVTIQLQHSDNGDGNNINDKMMWVMMMLIETTTVMLMMITSLVYCRWWL